MGDILKFHEGCYILSAIITLHYIRKLFIVA